MGGGLEFPQKNSRWDNGVWENENEVHARESYLRAVVDMGSNGIRFSVSDLTPPTSRILPTVHVHRLDISLFDAQYDPKTGARVPIPRSVIDAVIAALRRWQVVCMDLGVPGSSIRIIATEATRTAINSAEFRNAIKASTGLTVEMLHKEDEGKIGALGIASSFTNMAGLVMDLGGGSTQISWMIVHEGEVRTSPKGAFSFPYGAAALTRRLEELTAGKSKKEAEKAKDKLREEMKANFLDAYKKLEIPPELIKTAKKEGGFPLYLSGGGFRGWGYLLLYQSQVHGHHYPISLINGFSAHKADFENTEHLKEVAHAAHKIFRVSDRRRAQVPAVAFLVNVLATALPHGIKEAHFCQGGVREGVLFQELPPNIRLQRPLEVATAPFARHSASVISEQLLSAIPEPSSLIQADDGSSSRHFPESIGSHVIRALANTLYVHSVMSKETASTAALYSTSTGIMSTTHGVSHSDRALLALILEERYQGTLPPREVDFKHALGQLLTKEELWWTRYLGKVGYLVANVYPSGYVDSYHPRIRLEAEWASDLGKDDKEEKEDEDEEQDNEGWEEEVEEEEERKEEQEEEAAKEGLLLKVYIAKIRDDPLKLKETLEEAVRVIEKVGKRKNWVDGWGMHVKVVVEEDSLF